MFDDLLSLEKDRTHQQAFGFYLAYLLTTVLGGVILGGLAGVFAVLICLGVSFGTRGGRGTRKSLQT